MCQSVFVGSFDGQTYPISKEVVQQVNDRVENDSTKKEEICRQMGIFVDGSKTAFTVSDESNKGRFKEESKSVANNSTNVSSTFEPVFAIPDGFEISES